RSGRWVRGEGTAETERSPVDRPLQPRGGTNDRNAAFPRAAHESRQTRRQHAVDQLARFGLQECGLHMDRPSPRLDQSKVAVFVWRLTARSFGLCARACGI